MNILIFNTSEIGIAPNRLFKSLIKKGINVKMLVRDKLTNDENVVSINTTWLKCQINSFRFLWERIIILLSNKIDRKSIFKVSIANTGSNVLNNNCVKEADIIHLHWINQGFLSLHDILLLTQNKPIVWTMHDMWPCTAICHHSWGCEGFTKNCGMCPFLKSKREKDLSYRIWNKKKFIASSNIHIVTVSSWLAMMAKKSSLTKNLNVTVIPNVIDTTVFFKRNKAVVRKELSFSLDKNIILMGAARLDDPIKGFEYLEKALLNLVTDKYRKEDILLLLFGTIKDLSILQNISVSYVWLGALKDMSQIADLYSAADVVVVPSFYETFGQTIIEAMACGCLAVSFNNSGQTDIIDHKVNGYLAQYKNVTDFAEGIDWALSNRNNQTMQESCIKKVQENYTEAIIAEKYISLYKSILKE